LRNFRKTAKMLPTSSLIGAFFRFNSLLVNTKAIVANTNTSTNAMIVRIPKRLEVVMSHLSSLP
jgi:hypothetical protein